MSAISLFDWEIYRDLLTTSAMAEIFDETATIAAWLEVERAVLQALESAALVPPGSADALQKAGGTSGLDLKQLHADTAQVGRPIVGFVGQLREQIDDRFRAYVHFGVTTYDVMDTGRVLQIRRGLDRIEGQLTAFIRQLASLAKAERDTVMVARTNGHHAMPSTFGAHIAPWIEEMLRHADRLQAVRERCLVLQMGGAVGSLAALHPHGLSVRQDVAKRLGLKPPLSNWHNARDAMAEVTALLGLLCSSLARIARDINMLASTDIAEVTERAVTGGGISSTMAHKSNPRAAEYTEAIARLGRQRAHGMAEMMAQAYDRCGSSWIGEWMLIPETFLLSDGALTWAGRLFDRLHINREQMHINLDKTKGLILTECYTMALARHMDKIQARALMDRVVAEARSSQQRLPDSLKSMPEVADIMSAADIDELAAYDRYVGHCGDIVDATVAQADTRLQQG